MSSNVEATVSQTTYSHYKSHHLGVTKPYVDQSQLKNNNNQKNIHICLNYLADKINLNNSNSSGSSSPSCSNDFDDHDPLAIVKNNPASILTYHNQYNNIDNNNNINRIMVQNHEKNKQARYITNNSYDQTQIQFQNQRKSSSVAPNINNTFRSQTLINKQTLSRTSDHNHHHQQQQSKSSTDNNNNNSNNQNLSRYKTELCRPFEERNGTCSYGDKCQFAHGSDELRTIDRHPKYKTQFCRTFHTTGFCPYGPRCHFIHNSLGKPPPEATSSNLINEPKKRVSKTNYESIHLEESRRQTVNSESDSPDSSLYCLLSRSSLSSSSSSSSGEEASSSSMISWQRADIDYRNITDQFQYLSSMF